MSRERKRPPHWPRRRAERSGRGQRPGRRRLKDGDGGRDRGDDEKRRKPLRVIVTRLPSASGTQAHACRDDPRREEERAHEAEEEGRAEREGQGRISARLMVLGRCPVPG